MCAVAARATLQPAYQLALSHRATPFGASALGTAARPRTSSPDPPFRGREPTHPIPLDNLTDTAPVPAPYYSSRSQTPDSQSDFCP
jgi:hypothetical protein